MQGIDKRTLTFLAATVVVESEVPVGVVADLIWTSDE